MILTDFIKDLCITTEVKSDNPKVKVHWMSYDYVDSANIFKQKLREAKVEAIVNNDDSNIQPIIDEYKGKQYWNAPSFNQGIPQGSIMGLSGKSDISEITVSVKTLDLTMNPLTGYEDFDSLVFNEYMKIVNSQKSYETFAFDKTKTDVENSKKIITKIMRCANKIAIESRIGPANKVILSSNIYNFINNNIPQVITNGVLGGLQIIKTDRISDNMIITFRVSDSDRNGVNFYYSNNGWILDTHGKPMVEWIQIQ